MTSMPSFYMLGFAYKQIHFTKIHEKATACLDNAQAQLTRIQDECK